MFWLVMTAVATVGAVAYLTIAALGGHRGMSSERRRTFHNSGVLLIGWAAVCWAHHVTGSP